jgi:ankyrin repeat protein
MLVSNGADINARDLDGNTPIHFCSEYGHADTLKWLLVKEPQMNIKNR